MTNHPEAIRDRKKKLITKKIMLKKIRKTFSVNNQFKVFVALVVLGWVLIALSEFSQAIK
jgi:hypothetical protein